MPVLNKLSAFTPQIGCSSLKFCAIFFWFVLVLYSALIYIYNLPTLALLYIACIRNLYLSLAPSEICNELGQR